MSPSQKEGEKASGMGTLPAAQGKTQRKKEKLEK
jgi:hypothetical protein